MRLRASFALTAPWRNSHATRIRQFAYHRAHYLGNPKSSKSDGAPTRDGDGWEPNIERQHNGGKLTVRERIELLSTQRVSPKTGVLAGRAEYDDEGNLRDFRPANFVAGFARIDGRPRRRRWR